MARNRNERRQNKTRFAGIPHHIMNCENYKHIGAWETRLLLELARQYNGSNNGDLSAPWSQLKNRGWKSKGTLNKAIKNLLRFGMIDRTRQGGKHKCSLYSLTWENIDECNGKLEVAPTRKASNRWKIAPEN
ncbi:MAG: hypothetical protein VXY23_03795 [Pseudomonadota bacterium]|nr:hypothetical protein [Pseudomonadota bacterium]